jgi:hypothetical protein
MLNDPRMDKKTMPVARICAAAPAAGIYLAAEVMI